MKFVSKAKLSNFRVTPRKARLVAGLIRGKKVEDALNTLAFNHKKSAPAFSKLIKSAVSNAEQKGVSDPDNLSIAKLVVNQGMVIKRFLPRSRGMASPILKRSSHIELYLKES